MTVRAAFSPEATSGLEGPPVSSGYAFITECFSGIQGEGPYVGVRQIFVRFGGCDLRCWWCDTPLSLTRREPGRYEKAPGTREFEVNPNPIALDSATRLIRRLRPERHHSVTFTGGEPLLQPEGIEVIAKSVHADGGHTWLETHGGRVNELRQVIDYIDVVSMDVKVPSSSGEDVPTAVHEEFLSIASQKDVFAKLVVTPDTLDEEIFEAAKMVRSVRSDITFVLQPVTPFARIKERPSPERMLEVQSMCLEIHNDVRVIPQTHKFLGQM